MKFISFRIVTPDGKGVGNNLTKQARDELPAKWKQIVRQMNHEQL